MLWDRSPTLDESDRQAKCVLCSRDIAREPIVRLLNGQRLEFDKGECRLIFDRLVAVYGTSFGFELRDS
jgi:hypothetical protein